MGGQNQYDNSRPTKGTADSWDKGFIEDKPAEEQNNAWSPVLLRKDENRKSGKALTNPLEGKVTSQTPSTVKTANGAVYRKSDIAQAKIKSPLLSQSTRNTKSSKGEQVKNKLGGKNVRLQETLDLENEDSYKKKTGDTKATERFQESPVRVTSRDTESGGLNLAVKRAKPNNGGPTLSMQQQINESIPKKKNKKPTVHEARRAKAATAVSDAQNAVESPKILDGQI